MSVRFCPNCKTELGSYDFYFCSSCGATLPPEVTVADTSPKKIVTVEPEMPAHKLLAKSLGSSMVRVLHIINAKKLASIFGMFLLVIAGIIYWYAVDGDKIITISPMSTRAVVPESTVSAPILQASSGSFGDASLAVYAPENIDLYFESYDLDALATDFVQYDTGYMDFVKQLKGKMVSRFGVFIKLDPTPTYGLVMQAKDTSFNVALLNLTKFSSLQLKQVGKYVVISTDASLMAEVVSAINGTRKNFSMNSKYILMQNNYPLTGKTLIVTPTVKGAAYLETLDLSKFPYDLKRAIQIFVTSKKESVIIT